MSNSPSENHASTPRIFADWRIALGILAVLWFAIYVFGLSWPPLLDDVDSVHAEAAREMIQRHDFVTLYINGFRYLEKAPMMYWGLIASYKLFGVSTLTTRLPLVLGVLALVVATWKLGRYAYGPRAAFYSGLSLVTSLGLYMFTRFLIPEVLVALWLTLGYLLFLQSLEEKHPSVWLCWGFAAISALNVLTKGLIGLVFPIGAIGLYLILTGNLKHLLKLRLISSSLVFLLIAAPWHVLAALRNPPAGASRGFLWFYFINEHVMRFLNKRVPAGYDTVPLFLFWALLVAFLIPWSIFLPQALRDLPPRWWMPRLTPRTDLDRRQRANLLFLLWALVIVGFFSFSTRQEYYTIPALPGAALLVGQWLARESEAGAAEKEKMRRSGSTSSLVLFVVGVLGLIAGSYLLAISHPPAPGFDLADLLKKNPNDYNLSLGHVLDLTPRALGAFRWPLMGATFGLFLGTGLNWLLRRKGRPGAANVALTLMMVVLLTCVHVSYATFSPIISSYNLAMAVQKEFHPGDMIVVGSEYADASTLNFYTGIPLHILHEPSGALWYGNKWPDAPRLFETRESLATKWNAPERIFYWTDKEQPADLAGLQTYPLAHSGGKTIYMNHPLP
ncbi:MAG: glycosyltransferase family 39 protein [Acidobacteriota bacterium]|nr:glycosyltransferase family 39 protein [Acidobacteriota bacterium]